MLVALVLGILHTLFEVCNNTRHYSTLLHWKLGQRDVK